MQKLKSQQKKTPNNPKRLTGWQFFHLDYTDNSKITHFRKPIHDDQHYIKLKSTTNIPRNYKTQSIHATSNRQTPEAFRCSSTTSHCWKRTAIDAEKSPKPLRVSQPLCSSIWGIFYDTIISNIYYNNTLLYACRPAAVTPCGFFFNNDEPSNHFIADCNSATDSSSTCSLTVTGGYWGGSVTCDTEDGLYDVAPATGNWPVTDP